MPTVVLLDSSLSMARLAIPKSDPNRPIELSSTGEELELRHLAAHGISHLVEQIETNCKLEQVALLQYSSHCELTSPFSRDMDMLRSKLLSLSCQDKSSLEVGIKGFVGVVQEEWGLGIPVTLIIVTDGGLGYGPYSLYNIIHANPTELRLPIPFPVNVSVACINPDSEENPENLEKIQDSYKTLFYKLGLTEKQTSFHKIEGPLSLEATENMFAEISSLHYNQWVGDLVVGDQMTSKIQVCPPPKSFSRALDFSVVTRELSKVVSVKGFMSQADLSSPPVFSRHLILPHSLGKENKDEDSKVPNVCLFLHGGLKVENMCALVEIGEDWYGFVYPWSDNKKKSALMLSILEPGTQNVPWIGCLNRLGPATDLNETINSPFPIKSDRKPSYSSSPVVWIKQTGIQSDIQKVLRHARKLPEKTPQFYKELNRLKRAAVCLGFYELLEGVAQICERECNLLPPNVSPDCAIQLTHVAKILRSGDCYDVNHTILPRVTNFNAGNI
eukprot:TRINITY_DN3169_c0_g1_i6.p1 TRINITY_DN3169_c0_g1~~TRINITY_DN3169_c0_g1_i6.p1  ORF type:complete len:508 (+),score=91.69 TRINITY_DN3169_c0_g1_i6:22-1524(+)